MSDLMTADPVNGVKNVPPAFPIKPVQPGPEERRSGQRRKKPPAQNSSKVKRKPDADPMPDSDDDAPHTIDEYV